MKIILKKKIEDCVCFKCSRGYSYELTLWNIFNLSRKVEKEDFIEPSNENEINELFDAFIQSTTSWINAMERVRQIKVSNYRPMQFSTSLMLSNYQTKAFEICQTLDRAFLFMEQGTGKTPVALSIVHSRPDCSTLIVCPKAVRKEWATMIEQFFPDMQWSIITENNSFVPVPGHAYIVNYDRMRLMDKMNFDQIILDECHRLKNPTGASNKALYEIQKKARYVYGLTGTPYGNNIVDVFGICKVVDERLFGTTKTMFEDRYCNIMKQRTRDGKREFPVIKSYKNMEEFKTKLDSISYRVLKKDCLDLIDPVSTRLWVENSKEYALMKQDYVLETNNGVAVLKSVLNLTFKLQQICSGFIRTDEGWSHINENKLSAFTDWVLDNDDSQAVIYVTYDMSEEMITHKLWLLGKTFGTISGKISDEEKEATKQKFKDKEIQFVVIKYKSGTEGLNFQNCNKMIFYDLTPSLIDYEQAKSRIHRRGQERECEYIHLITENSVEEKMYKALQERKDFSEYLLEGNTI